MTHTALPVALDLADADLAADVAAHIESVLGWQVVRPGPHLPVRLLLADRLGHPGPRDVPTVVIVRGEDAELLRRSLQAGALDVLVWPRDAGRLAELPLRQRRARPAAHLLAVAGAAPGVGASTVVLAIGGLSAWGGRRTVVVTDAAGRGLAGVAPGPGCAVQGIPGLSLAGDVQAAVGDGVGGEVEVLLVDVGCDRRGHVLVGRPDRALVTALAARPDSRTVVTVGEGALRPAELRSVLGHRRHVHLAWSFRVGRAGLRGRVPIALPGTWLGALRPVLGVPAEGVAA